MNRDEILAMPAGKKMDAIVYKKIVDKEYLSGEYLPECSTNISAAWQVVEKLKERGEIIRVEWFPADGEEPSCYEVVLEAAHDIEPYLFTRADTAPLAICRAALLAVMGAE